MKFTDKDYYIEKALIEKLDLSIERHKKGRDTLFIVDGGEGDGKSTATVGWAYYVAQKMGIPLTVNNVFFDAEKMMKFAAENTSQIIIWDEAATTGMAMNWQNRTQQKLIKILMMCRKKQHFWFFVIPKFWKLNEYIVDRAVGLMHVYSPDLIRQGYFVYFKRTSKDYLYQLMHSQKYKSYRRHHSFRGTFVRKGFVIDEKEYDRRKDAAIMDLFKDKNMPDVMTHAKEIHYKAIAAYKPELTQKARAKELNCHKETIKRADNWVRAVFNPT